MSLLVADFGGTRIKLGLVKDGRVLALRVRDTRRGTLRSQLPELGDEFAALANAGDSRPEAMVWALPCIIAPDHSTVTRTFGKFDDVPNMDLAGWVDHHFGIPLFLDNDARAAAAGEWTRGAGRGYGDMVMVTLGTGIGTAVISRGTPLYGRTGLAGNLGGHNILHAGGRECVCGLRGCAEAHAATWALPRIARESPLFGKSLLARESVIDYRAVFLLAREGDELAMLLKESALADWSALVVNLVCQFDPGCVVLGGGIMEAAAEILPPLDIFLSSMFPASGVSLRSAVLGDTAALLGCEALWNHFNAYPAFPSHS